MQVYVFIEDLQIVEIEWCFVFLSFFSADRQGNKSVWNFNELCIFFGFCRFSYISNAWKYGVSGFGRTSGG